ncbi:type I-E CRISPR-associated protein Cse2/CasB [Kiritimatiella glycovorans]|uniref:CRISPR-associated Cse2 family protein n=1 Tax=Kiritimatiella glycovorans TaxID=1307763 RepID=A0A0G3EFW8_9BACT|nr:type I-E CRISPR-associated protein Cse2/CasB [Kiritimatiella glycovorans]AKJ65311.1 CRISPR-associated Cse2 family protein [Kiritimatiella glycovorans]
MKTVQEKSEGLMNFLRSNRKDRGLMADLRCGFSRAKQHRAWPHIAGYCQLDEDKSRTPVQTVCAAYATHPEEAVYGNMGTVMRQIAIGMNGKDGLSSFEARFRRLISCQTTEEICNWMAGFVRAAKSSNIPVNYKQLYCDLFWWEGEYPPKLKWASSYWGAEGGRK